MPITAQALSDLRADFGDPTGAVFTDAELERLWERVSGAEDALTRHEATLGLMFRQVLHQADKLHDYSAGATSTKLAQVREHLRDSYRLYEKALHRALGGAEGLSRAVVRSKPRAGREAGE